MQFRNDIQGLRALAFLLVFIFHLNSAWLPGGFLGVDLFFVISGYLITTISLSDIAKNKFSFTNFFIKRIKRIVPAYLAVLAAVSIVGIYIYLYTDILYLRGTILRSALFISNQLFASGDSYFGAKLSENPLLHTWSLAIEMQFYVILPFVLWFGRRKLKIVLPVIIIITTIFSTYNLYVLDHKAAMYFSLIARVPEFLIGAYFAVLLKEGISYNRTMNNVVASLSLIILLLSAWFITAESNFPGYIAVIPCIASATLLVIKNNFVSDFFARKIPVFIGEMSYSLYLWHWPIIAFIRYTNDGYELTISQIAFVSIMTFVCAWLSYMYIEKMLRKQTNKHALITISVGSLMIAVLYFFIPWGSKQRKLPDMYTKPIMGLESNGEPFIQKFGDPSKNDSIILIGDSHALMLKPFLNKVGIENKFSYYTLTTSSFPPIEGIIRSEITESKLKYYDISVKLIPKTDSLIKNNKIIILNIFGLKNNLPSLEKAIYSLAKNIRNDQRLVLIATFPTVSKNPLKVNNSITKFKEENNPVKINNINKKKLRKIASLFPNVYYFDLSRSQIFRDAPYINDTVAYYDAEHINHFASLKLADDIGNEFYRFLQAIDKNNDKK